ncbi:UpxY family transcription antiterminator [Nitrospira sp. Nam80]
MLYPAVERGRTMTVSQRAKLHTPEADLDQLSTDLFAAQWFALQTKSRHEKVVKGELQRQSIETFLPTLRRVSQWKDRKKTIEFPLFSGYCFARFSLYEKRLSILQAPGVVRIVGSHSYPEPIPDHEIESLQILWKSQYPHNSHPFLKEGMSVEIVRGPLQGATGRLVRHARQCRIVLSITLIQQAVAVEVDASDVMPVEPIPVSRVSVL